MPLDFDPPAEQGGKLEFDPTPPPAPPKPPRPPKPTTADLPVSDPMGGYTGGMQTVPIDRKSDLSFQKGFGKGTLGSIVGFPGEVVNIPRTAEQLGRMWYKNVLQLPVSQEPAIPRFEYGVPEMTEKMFGKPTSPAEAGGRVAGEFLGPEALLAGPGAIKALRAPSAFEQAMEAARGVSGRVRAAAEKQVGKVIETKESASAALEQRLSSLDKALEQIGQRDVVAAQRAAGRALNPEEVAGIQSAVTNRVREAARQAERDALATGMKAEEATAHAGRVADQLIEAEAAVARLEAELLSKPQMRPEEFGAQIRAVAEQLREKYAGIREREAGFEQAIKGAGNKPIVDTSRIQNYINKQLRQSRDPALSSVLTEINFLLATPIRGQDMAVLNIAQADSLRKYISRILSTKQITYRNGTQGDAAAAIADLSKIQDMLVSRAAAAHKPYGEALRKYRELSRPLDIVQRKGPLRQVLDTDLLSQEFLQGTAAVAGRVIQRAKEGQPVFTRLLAESPELQNAARLYFNRELFGRNKVPTVDALATFLKENEGVLRQLNLYDEFSTIEKARRTADTAVKNLKVEKKAATETVGELLGETKGLEKEAARSRKLVEEAKRREQAAKEAVVPAEDIAKAGEKRAVEAEKRLLKERGAVSTERAQTEAVAEKYRMLETQLAAARPEEVAREARKIADAMRKDQLVDDVNYFEMLKQIQMVQDRFGEAEQARAMTGNILQRFLLSAATKLGRGVVK